MACGSCGGTGRQPQAVTTGNINAAQQYQVNYPNGTSETFSDYLTAVRAKKGTPGATMNSV